MSQIFNPPNSDSASQVFNPWSLPRPPLREDERDYTDPRHPGVSVRLRFRELNPFSEAQAIRLYGEYADKFIKPRSQGNGKEPTPQLLPTPEPILLNEVILDELVMLQAMQVPASPDTPRYGLTHWCGFAVNMPDAYREMLRVCRNLNKPVEQDSGNQEKPENGSGTESSTPQSEQDPLIQNGCSTPPDASEASPERSEPSLDASGPTVENVGLTRGKSTSAS